MATEWDDAHMKVGTDYGMKLREEAAARKAEEELEELALEAAANYDPLEHKNLDQLDELEDDEDERILAAYREKRLQEMKEQAKNSRFGDVREIAQPDWEAEVTKSGNTFVVAHLYSNSVSMCEVVDRAMMSLASKFGHVKFVRIVGSRCIPDYPDRNCPTILVYNNGDIQSQIVRCEGLGGAHMTPDDLEWRLSILGAVKTDLEDDPAVNRPVQKMTFARGAPRDRRNDDSDVDSD